LPAHRFRLNGCTPSVWFPRVVVIISANIEWQTLLTFFPVIELYSSPLGEWFKVELALAGRLEPVIFFHGGWGKIAAAASTQYIIDRWQPDEVEL
jgi:adenosylhomocysteine nucleosidase